MAHGYIDPERKIGATDRSVDRSFGVGSRSRSAAGGLFWLHPFVFRQTGAGTSFAALADDWIGPVQLARGKARCLLVSRQRAFLLGSPGTVREGLVVPLNANEGTKAGRNPSIQKKVGKLR